MNKNGYEGNQLRRRGTSRKKQCLAVAVGIVVIVIVYTTFMPDSDSTYEHLRDTHISQNRFVQKEIRTEAPKMGKHVVQSPSETAGDDDHGVEDDVVVKMGSNVVQSPTKAAGDDDRDVDDDAVVKMGPNVVQSPTKAAGVDEDVVVKMGPNVVQSPTKVAGDDVRDVDDDEVVKMGPNVVQSPTKSTGIDDNVVIKMGPNVVQSPKTAAGENDRDVDDDVVVKMGPNVVQSPTKTTGDDNHHVDDDDYFVVDDADDDVDDTEDTHLLKKSLGEQNKTEVKEIHQALTKSNWTYTPVNRMNTFISESKGKIFANTKKLKRAFSDWTIGMQTEDNIPVKEKKNIEEYKVKLAEDFAAQTKELAKLVQGTLNKNATNLSDINWQNKTKPLDRNLTKLIEKFSFKAQNAMKLANDILFSKTVSLPGSNQNTNEQNITKSNEAFSMETQDLTKIANDVFSDTSKSALQTKEDETRTKFLDKYAFDAQKLAKFASSLVSPKTMKVVDEQQKLMKLQLPRANMLPLSSDVKNLA